MDENGSPGDGPRSGVSAQGRDGWDAVALLLAVAGILVGAAAWFHADADGSDLWWHMNSGRWIWENRAIPWLDPFSHTAADRSWVNHEWGWGVLTWLGYRAGPELLAWVNLGLIAAIFSLVAWNSFRASRSWLATAAVTWLAAAASHWFLDVRPHLVTLLFTVLLLATFEWRRAPWLWAPLMLFWVNLHGGFIFGVGLVGLHVLFRSGAALRSGALRRLPRAECLGLAATALVVLANPWGAAIYAEPFAHLEVGSAWRELLEWRPAELALDPRGYAGRFTWMLLAALSGVWRARRTPFLPALAMVTAVMALAARKFVPLFAITAAPLAAVGLAGLLGPLEARLVATRPRRVAAAALCLAMALLPWKGVRFLPHPLQRWTRLESFPTGAVTYLASLPDPPKHLFHVYHWGGYLSFHAPAVPIFIDGRAVTLYDETLARDYQTLHAAEEGWQELLRRYGIDGILVERPSPLARAIAEEGLAWRHVYPDPRSILLLPRDGSSLPPLESSVGGSDLALSRGFQARNQGRLELARERLEESVRLDPLQLHGYRELMLLAAIEGDPDELRHWVDQALRVYPRRRNQIWSDAEYSWGLLGERSAQLEALRHLRQGSPFATPVARARLGEKLRRLEGASDAETPAETGEGR